MTERVYWSYFAMLEEGTKDLAVVVLQSVNDQWVTLDCQIDSDPMSMEQAQAEALR
jgi:hypothetical protein